MFTMDINLPPPRRITSAWVSWALPSKWTWTPEDIAEQIVIAAACCESPTHRTYGGTKWEKRRSLRRWRRIALHCISIMPDNADAWIVLAHTECWLAFEIYTKKPHQYYEASKRAYRAAAKLKPDARTWRNLGDVCMFDHDRKGQFVAYAAALEINPDDIWARWHLATAFAEAGDNHEAVRLLRQSIELLAPGVFWTETTVPTTTGLIYVDLGLNEMCLGNTAEAINALLQAAIWDKGVHFDDAVRDIAESFYEHGEAAVELRDRLSEVNPSLAAKFFTRFQPIVGTVIRAKGYCHIKSDSDWGNWDYGDYFISLQEIEAAGIAALRVGDRVEFKTGTPGRRILPNHLKLLPRAEMPNASRSN